MTPTLRNGKRAAVLEALRQGNTRRAASEAAGIHHATFYRWIEEDATLNDAVKKAEADAEQEAIKHVRSAFGDSWQAAAWWLERRRRDDFGRNEKLTVIQQAAKEIANLSDEQLAGIAYGDDPAQVGPGGTPAPGDSAD